MLAFLACAAMMAFALYVQHGLGLEPCPLCILQRVAVIVLGVLFLLAAVQNPGPTGRRIYALLLVLGALSGAGVAARHIWLQSLPPDKVPACGPGFDYIIESFPLRDALQMVLSGSGECARITWSLLGVSMPGWVMVALLALGVFAAWNNTRRS
jgi:disulfide bond formation protein DsbB